SARQGKKRGAAVAARLTKIFLAQRRAMVRAELLPADDHQLAARVELSDGLRRRAARQPAPDKQIFNVRTVHALDCILQEYYRPARAGVRLPWSCLRFVYAQLIGIGRSQANGDIQNIA